MPKRSLVVVGDSSFAQVACEMFDADGRYEVTAFAVHAEYRKRDVLLGRPVHKLESLTSLCPPDAHDVFVALTYRELNRARARLCEEVKAKGYSLASFISSHAFLWPNVEYGENTFVFEHNVVQPFSRIGNNVILWSGNHIGHHTTIEDNVFIASHAVISGHCRIGRNCFIGVNATVTDNVTVAADNWIGPNALITKDTDEGSMWRTESTPKSSVDARRFFRIR